MTPQQIDFVQQSWEKVVPIAKDAAKLFYDRLFQLDPALRSIFHGDMEEQGRKLTTILTTVVRGLKNLEKLKQAVWQLGRRHAVYQVTKPMYATVAEALIWTLQQGLGAAFTDVIKEAWIEAYTVLASVMQAGANYRYANYEVWLDDQKRAAGG